MFKHKSALFWLALAFAGTPGLLTGATLYENLPNASGYNADTNSWSIHSSRGFAVSNSFVLSGESILRGVEFVSWTEMSGYFITSVDWRISSGDAFNGYGTTYGFGTAAVTSQFLFINTFGWDISSNTFSLPNINLSAGSYFLTLSNAETNDGGEATWDQNDGPSEAWHNDKGQLGTPNPPCLDPCTGSESFRITGSVASVPEPATLALLGAGLLALTIRRRLAGRDRYAQL